MQRVQDCPLAFMENCRDYWSMPDDAPWEDELAGLQQLESIRELNEGLDATED